ncbi:MAG: L,D-transpeptidase family protein, partial [Bacteroidia bacterium]|nr:L,D-transpeptidase family protein [Bacteroidia bacterium]
IKLTYNLYKGVIDVPMSADSNWFHNPKDFNDDEFNTILDTLHGNGIVALIDHFNLNSSSNNKFRQELISLKKRYDNQGWPLVEYGESLKPNDVDQRIISVRERLLKQKFIDVNDSSLVYDGELEVAVKAFQKKFNLVNDGVIGKATIDAMNVPVSKRIESLVVSLERNRWLPLQYPNEYVVANIAGFNVRYYKGDTVFYASKSIVGRYKRQTPAFHDTMTYVEINPYWTIPPTILEEDVIPKVLKDSSYLKNKNIRVLTKAGKEISPDSIDWTSVNPKRVPYKLKKDPGPYNDLGRIKFMFPNRHMIYFHDTPSRYLFASNVTAFSSGCVRIQDPYDFANALFHGNERWGNDSIEVEINKGENKRIKLDHPVPVYIVYQTVWIDDDGDVIYGNDIYEKDSLIFSKLNYKLESIETDLGEIIKTDSTLIQ